MLSIIWYGGHALHPGSAVDLDSPDMDESYIDTRCRSPL